MASAGLRQTGMGTARHPKDSKNIPENVAEALSSHAIRWSTLATESDVYRKLHHLALRIRTKVGATNPSDLHCRPNASSFAAAFPFPDAFFARHILLPTKSRDYRVAHIIAIFAVSVIFVLVVLPCGFALLIDTIVRLLLRRAKLDRYVRHYRIACAILIAMKYPQIAAARVKSGYLLLADDLADVAIRHALFDDPEADVAASRIEHHRALATIEEATRDRIGFILYLRGFEAEASFHVNGGLRMVAINGSQVRAESTVARLLDGIPTVAIANAAALPGTVPTEESDGRRIPRVYCSPDDWESAVRLLIEMAGCIIIEPTSIGKGLMWELEQICQIGRQDDTYVLDTCNLTRPLQDADSCTIELSATVLDAFRLMATLPHVGKAEFVFPFVARAISRHITQD